MNSDQDSRSSCADMPEGARAGGVFVTTHWSVVLEAAQPGNAQARIALEQLCRGYWYPLYAYVRRRGYLPPDAQDLTQEFFSRLLEGNWLARADRSKGRFRTFLLTAIERFLANEWDKAHALKRGGSQPPLSLQLDTGETRYNAEPVDPRTPEQAFERSWALALLGQVVQQLEQEYRSQNRADLFLALRPHLIGDRDLLPHAELGEQLGLTDGAVRVAVHRLRQRYRELLRAEIARTVVSAAEVNSEMRHLFNVLAAG